MPQTSCDSDMFGNGFLLRTNLDLILRFLRDLGYTTTTARLRTDEYGLPQRRVRIYFFGVKESGTSTQEQSELISATLTALKTDLNMKAESCLVSRGCYFF
jgi:site-specific DNA-cytosine methylase